jgi:uncharacterized membrane protein YcaP (DUF421 family)
VTVAGILVRIAFTYVFFLLVVRLAGKRTIREGTPFDFLVALMLGDFPDDVIWGEVSVVQGVVAIGTVMTLHLAVSYASYQSAWFDRLLGAAPDLLFRGGLSDRRGLRRARMNESDLDAELRRAGHASRADITEASLEATGEISIRVTDSARVARRRDIHTDSDADGATQRPGL